METIKLIMNKTYIYLLVAAIVLTVGAIFGFDNAKTQLPMLSFNDDDYDKEWQEIDSLDRKGLPESALEKVILLYDKAKADDNPPQVVKALLYREKYNANLEEDGQIKAIFNLEQEIDDAKSPVKEILQSAVAQLYQTYMNDNYWRFKDRSDTDEFTPEDIRTWSLEKLATETARLYQVSVTNRETQRVAIKDFEVIVSGKKEYNTDNLRPTLYDILAHRALDYFMNERSYLTEPANAFHIESEEVFAPATTFLNYKFKTTDIENKKYQTLLLFQEILAFHAKDKNPEALIDADLKRIKFVYQQSIHSDKEKLYANALNQLSKKYSKHASKAEIDYHIAQIHHNKSNDYTPEKKELKWERKEALEICNKVIKEFSTSYGAQLCRSLKATILQKSYSLNTEEVNVSNTAFPVLINYRNVEDVHYKVVKLDNDKLGDLQNVYNEDVVNYLNKLPILKSGFFTLPDDSDYMDHSTEFKVDGLAYGTYYILASNNKSFDAKSGAVAWIKTTVSDLAYHSKNSSTGATEYFVVNRKTGAPVAAVNVDYYSRNYNSILRKYKFKKEGTAITDKEGYTTITAGKNNSFYIKMSKDKDYQDFNDNFYSYQNNQEKRTTYHNHFFLDRAIYRPGQTVYFKSLPIQRDGETKMPSILANEKVKIIFRDANYQEIKSLELKTNEYGTVNGTFQAPQSGMLGRMTLACIVKGKEVGQHNFRVEEYKRPKFEVTFEPITKGYKLGDKIEVTGLGKAFAGNNIDNAKVTYRVVRETRYPYWGYWWRPYPSSPSQEITSGETTTDEKGNFIINFEAIPDKSADKKNKPLFTYTVYADVVDITGETRSSSTSIQVGTIALDIDIKTPQKINRNNLDSFVISSKNLNGEFEAAKGSVTIHQLNNPGIFIHRYWNKPDQFLMTKEEYKKAFPNRAYKDENEMQNWSISKEVLNSSFNTKNSKSLTLKKGDFNSGKYKLVLSTEDKYGQKITLEKYFDVFDTGDKKTVANSDFFHSIQKTKLEPGENAVIHVGSGYENAKVLFRVEFDDKIIRQEWMNLKGLEKITIPIKEEYRGGISYHLNFVHNNRNENVSSSITIPWSNKDLKIEFATFRDKLYPGQEEEWQLKLSGPKGDKVTAEMVAAMYDASLDEFAVNNWYLSLYPSNYNRLGLRTNHFSTNSSSITHNNWQYRPQSTDSRYYRNLNWFGFPTNQYMMRRAKSMQRMRSNDMAGGAPAMSAPAPMMEEAEQKMDYDAMDVGTDANISVSPGATYKVTVRDSNGNTVIKQKEGKEEDFSEVKVRTNLDETVFFFPNLATDKEGNIIIKFTMNEALTKWKFLGLAHTKDLKIGKIEKEIVTQKDLMVMPNPPRFFREGDEIEFTAKVSNLTESAMNGTAVLQLFDAITNEPVDVLLGNDKAQIPFSAKAGQSAPLKWILNIPKGKVNAITHRVIAKSGDFSDGEEDALPVLTNRMMVTETLPLPVRGKQTKEFSFTKLKNSGSSNTLQHHQMTLEFTSNPAWYAVQSLPYLMEYPYDCTEQIFSRYYANSLATTVANSNPNVKKVFDKWKNTDAMKSNLSKNQELKYALLEDTPWVLDAQNEEQQKKNIGLLFDLNRMASEQEKAIAKITERQLSNGGFSWFPDGRDSWYITQYLVEGMGHLDRLGVKDIREDKKVNKMLTNAVQYCDARIVDQYNELLKRVKKGYAKLEDDNLNSIAIHYLYARSYFNDVKMNAQTTKVMNYYIGQAEKYWLNKGLYQDGLIALALERKDGYDKTTGDIVKSLKERSLNNEEMGMYWKYNTGYYWYQLPIETHALMIEVFDEVAKDEQAVDDLKVWLLKNKQTNNWKTTKGTAAAVYALLMRGDNWLVQDKDIQITIGGKAVDVASLDKEAGTGYFKTKTKGKDVRPEMGNVTVTNPNDVVAWGAMYWQYLEDLDKITTFEETPLTIKKQLFIETNSAKGPVINPIDGKELKPGDKLKVRIELRVDRDMEYVHMKDMRASGLEPINVLSSYKWQDGLGYYESTRDASTNFFFDRLPKGTYVFEYPLRVQHKGDFSNGITTIQCMYAPEFTSHSEGVRIEVK